VIISQTYLNERLSALLRLLGTGQMDSVAYDTAWAAQMDETYWWTTPALDWLRGQQNEDGSWGSSCHHYHDRQICTLASLIALQQRGTHSDKLRIQRGLAYLRENGDRLHQDIHDTVGFPILAVAMTQRATALHLDVPSEWARSEAPILAEKLRRLPEWQSSTLAFSLEGLTDFVSGNALLGPGGSVAASPAATMAAMDNGRVNSREDAPWQYLTQVWQPDGGFPDVAPIDLFEIGWSILWLKQAGAIHPGQVRSQLETLWKYWQRLKGLPYSSEFPVADLDCTSVGFDVLRWGGYPVDYSVFVPFEREDHFACYPGEIDLSLSAHVRLLHALHWLNGYPSHWIEKIVSVICRYVSGGNHWYDKWHISPYYLTGTAAVTLCVHNPELARASINWIIKTQRTDGGWSSGKQSTLEETAYCLLSLLAWEQQASLIDPEVLIAAARFLLTRYYRRAPFEAQWIGKCLYTPRYAVESAILAALFGCRERFLSTRKY
jgi:hypothetical protein